MEAFGLVPNIIATIEATYKVIKFFEQIKSSGLDCNKYIAEASSSYILLQQVRERLHSNVADGCDTEPWSRHLQALAGEDGVLKHYKSDMEQVASILLEVKNYRFRRIFVWHREKEKIEDIFKTVERHKSALQLALSHDQLSLSGHTHEVLNRVEARIETTATLQAAEKAESDKEAIIQWIYQSTVNHENFQLDYNAAAQDGTGQAFLNSDTFRRWLEDTCTTIFCPGLPGAGKTVMASIVKAHLDEETMDTNHPTAVLYFNYKRHLEDHSHQTLLLAVLAQFLSRCEKIPDRLRKMFLNNKDPLRMDDTISILESIVQSSHRSFLIMDALDEFYDDDGARSRFLRLIPRLQASGNLRIMMTTRPHLADDPVISKWADVTIQITATDDDLHTYLDAKVCGFPYLPDDFDLRLSIADRIVEASAGIFLLAVLHSDSLKDAYNAYEVEDILENLSKGPDALDRAYEDATKRIDHQPANRQYYARLIISWMVQCLRPMTPAELQHAVTKPEHLERGPSASGLVKIDALVSFCAGLVTIDHESNVVRFVHYTTQEYFTRQRLTTWLPGADLDPARLCTTYLMSSKLLKAIERAHESWSERVRIHRSAWKRGLMSGDVSWARDKDGFIEGDELKTLLQDALADWPFLGYCKKHWAAHCSEFQTPLQDLLLRFLTGPAQIVYRDLDLQWCTQWDPAAPLGSFPTGEYVGHARLRQVTPISICSRWSLNHLISNLLDLGSDIRVAPMLEDKLGNNDYDQFKALFESPPTVRHIALDEPFLLACQLGNIELASMLLARTSIWDDVYYEALRAADEKKNLDMLDLIITRCPLDTISINQIAMCSSVDESRMKDTLLDCALHISPDQNLDGLQKLFERPNASFWVGYLLGKGLDVNTMYPNRRTGIELATAAGCIENVRIFLNYPGVQVCRAGERYSSELVGRDALELAAEGCHLEIFRALLSHVSSIPDLADLVQSSVCRVFQDLAGRGSVQSRPSQVAFIKSLLEYQDLNRLPFNQLEKVIESAVSGLILYDEVDMQEAILDLVLNQSSIDFRRRGIHGRTLVQTAVPHALAGYVFTDHTTRESVFSDEKYTRRLSMLLKHPSFDYSGQYNPLFQFLTEHPHAAVAIDDQGNDELGRIANIQMILKDPRFDPNTPDETGRTALSYASEYHAEYLVRVLLHHPLVNVNSTDVSGRTPLSYAAESEPGRYEFGDRSVLPILLANDNVRLNASYPDTEGITPLMYSCKLGRTKDVGLLLDIAGSEINLQDNHGRTPLLHALEAEWCYACKCEHEPLKVLLANPNIKVNAKDEDGRSALFFAFKRQTPWIRWDSGGPDVSLLLQHEDLDISEELLDMRDDDGQALNYDDVLRSVKTLRERDPETWRSESREWTPLTQTELRHLDMIESIFSVGRSPA